MSELILTLNGRDYTIRPTTTEESRAIQRVISDSQGEMRFPGKHLKYWLSLHLNRSGDDEILEEIKNRSKEWYLGRVKITTTVKAMLVHFYPASYKQYIEELADKIMIEMR